MLFPYFVHIAHFTKLTKIGKIFARGRIKTPTIIITDFIVTFFIIISIDLVT